MSLTFFSPRLMLILAALVASVQLGFAPAIGSETTANNVAVSPEVYKTIESRINISLDNPGIESIEPSPIPGVFTVRLKGSQFLFTDKSGSYMIAGELYGLNSNRPVNLSDQVRMSLRKEQLQSLNVDESIVFKAEGKVNGVINVFTDVDCGYCQLFHKQVPELNSKGVEVRYLAFPRGGLESEGYNKLVSAWCADDKQTTLTDLKNNREVTTNLCENNPVASQFKLGAEFGVRGTPSLILMDGTMIPGYQPAEQLLAIMGIK